MGISQTGPEGWVQPYHTVSESPRLVRDTEMHHLLSALADGQTRNNGGNIEISMRKLLQRIDPDYYRSVRLVIAHAELEQSRQWRVDVRRRSKIPLGTSCNAVAMNSDPSTACNGLVKRHCMLGSAGMVTPPNRGTLNGSQIRDDSLHLVSG